MSSTRSGRTTPIWRPRRGRACARGKDETFEPASSTRPIMLAISDVAELAFFPELQHMYKPLPDGMDGMAGFGLPGDTDVRVTDAIDEWITRAVPVSTPS